MNRLNEKQSKRGPSLRALACLAVGVGLFTASSCRVPRVDTRRHIEDRLSHLANVPPSEFAVSFLEGRIRIQNEAPRRQPALGLLPLGSELQLPGLSVERSLADALSQALTTLSCPNDRSPPPI
jgi:hypothetical protein